jgi:predicted O-methyltransferase YrrM
VIRRLGWVTPELRWDGSRLRVNSTDFVVDFFATAFTKHETFPLLKSREMLEALVSDIEELSPRRVMELGIAKGGSTAFIAEVADPEMFVAIEYEPEPLPLLTTFIERKQLGERLRVYYGVDQADTARLREIVAADFGTQPLDLVIDDASHRLEETRTSVNTLFPHVRPGGVFIIEDWPWAHAVFPEGLDTELAPDWPGGSPLTRLVFELVMTLGSQNGIIADLRLDHDVVRVTRGPTELDPLAFDIAKSFVVPDAPLLTPGD